MPENNLGNLFNKVKTVTKQAADATAKHAKLTRLRLKLMTLHSNRNQRLQNIGTWIFSFHKQGKKFDQGVLGLELKDDIAAVEEMDKQVEAIEAQIQAIEENAISVKDVTPQ